MKPLSSISPIDLCAFLKVQGWTQHQEGLADRLYVLQNTRFPRRQLVFPMDTTAPDYAESIQRVIEKISEMMGERSNQRGFAMNTLAVIAEHAAHFPEALKVELLHYTLFLEQKINNPIYTSQPIEPERRQLLRDKLEAAVRVNPFRDIADPCAWQCEIRQDRPLPGREN